MNKLLVGLTLSWTIAGCASSGGVSEESGKLVIYDCSNGESVSVRYLPEGQMAELLYRGDSIELQQQPSGSGFVYSDGPDSIRGKGDELVVEAGRKVPLRCQAR
jgi:membrane-bound inhibitor of C-type lysozyme